VLSLLSQWLDRHSWIVVLSELISVAQTRKSSAMTGPGNMSDVPKPPHCAWWGTFFYHRWPTCRCVVVQEKPAVSYTFFRTFPSHGIPEATDVFGVRFSVCSMPFCNNFIVVENSRIKQNFLWAAPTVRETFMPLVNLRFLYYRLTMRFFQLS
jgi:hypothetical protein